MNRIAPEAELLLCCARTEPSAEIRERIAALTGADLDWDAVMRMAAKHRLLPLLWHHLGDRLPTAARDRTERILRKGLTLTSELVRVMDLLAGARIRAMLYKGPALAQDLYGNLALRPFDDLDLLVPPSDVIRAVSLMVDHGYSTRLELTPAQRASHLRSMYHLGLHRESPDVTVELHWRAVPRYFGFRISHAQMWASGESTQLAGRTMPVLSPEVRLLMLTAHGAHHGWDRLIWICDIALLLRSGRLDWHTTRRLARRLGSLRMLLLGVRLARDLLGAPVPPAVGRRADRPPIRTLARLVRGWLFGAERPGYLDRRKFGLLVHERSRDRLAFLVYRAVLPTFQDFATLRIPDALFGLYVPVRAIRWVAGAATRPRTAAARQPS